MINKHLFNWSQVVTSFVKRNELQFLKKIVCLCLYISFVIWSSLNKIRSILKDVSVNLFFLEEIFEQLHLSVMTCCKFWTRYQVRCYEYIWLVIKLFSLFMFYKMSFQTINDNSQLFLSASVDDKPSIRLFCEEAVEVFFLAITLKE